MTSGSYATVDEAMQPCVGRPAIDMVHRWMAGDVSMASFDSEDRVSSWVCTYCLIELRAGDMREYHLQLVAMAMEPV